MQAPGPPGNYAEAVRGGLKKPPDRPAFSAFPGPGSAQQQRNNPFLVPRAYGNKAIRVYTRGATLAEEDVVDALRSQLGVQVGRVRESGPSHVDVALTGADDKKKVEHRSIQIGGEVYHIG